MLTIFAAFSIKGIGFIYIKSGTKIYPYADGGAQEHGMRAGTENIASIVGMAAALKKNCDHMDQTQNKLHQLEDKFLDVLKLSGIDFIRNGSTDHIPGNVNVSIRNASGEMLLHRLDLKSIAISTGSACDSVNTQVSHVIQAIRVPEEYAHGTIRISFGRDNEESDAVVIMIGVDPVSYGVEFDDRIRCGHRCYTGGGYLCADGHGWWCLRRELEPADEPPLPDDIKISFEGMFSNAAET